jgi:hypothetical protein
MQRPIRAEAQDAGPTGRAILEFPTFSQPIVSHFFLNFLPIGAL